MQISTIGLDLAKHVFQAHGIDASENVVVRKQLRRSQVMTFFEKLAPCLVGIEACASAHHWARELGKLGHIVRLMPASDVKAYVKRNKNDAADAAAICEAVRRPTVRSVAVKTRRYPAIALGADAEVATNRTAWSLSSRLKLRCPICYLRSQHDT